MSRPHVIRMKEHKGRRTADAASCFLLRQQKASDFRPMARSAVESIHSCPSRLCFPRVLTFTPERCQVAALATAQVRFTEADGGGPDQTLPLGPGN